jgi:hypothetical protein
MLQILKPYETLEELRAKLQQVSGRPALISACEQACKDHRYRLPGSTEYVPPDVWTLFLTTLTEGGFVARVPKDDDAGLFDLFYYDLDESPYLRIIIPRLEGDAAREGEVRQWFREAGLWQDYAGDHVLSDEASIPG